MAPKKVLVVDCDELVCWALEKEFSALCMTVRSVRTGDAALAAAREFHWDLAFVEVRLPDIEGIELLERLRAILPETHFFVLGCDPTPELRRRAFADGAEQVVDKPFDLVDVVNAARSSLGGFAMNRRFSRYLCRVPLRIAIEPFASGEPTIDYVAGRTLDVSAAGLRLRTAYPVRVGQRIEVYLKDAAENPCGGLASRVTPGRVVWTAPRHAGYGVGLRFVA